MLLVIVPGSKFLESSDVLVQRFVGFLDQRSIYFRIENSILRCGQAHAQRIEMGVKAVVIVKQQVLRGSARLIVVGKLGEGQQVPPVLLQVVNVHL